MKIHKLYIFVLISLCFASCETEVDMGDIPIESRAVINAVLAVDKDTNFIYLTESRSIFRPGESAHWGKDPYTYITDADVYLSVNNISEKLEYSPKDSAYLYLKPLQINDRVGISTMYKGKEVSSSSIMPSTPQVLSIDTTTIRKVRSGVMKKYLKYNVKIKDFGNTENFYRIKVDIASHYQSPDWEDFEYWTYTTRFRSDDVILNNGNPENIDDDDLSIVTFPPNYYGIFTNTLFNGQEYVLSFYIDYPDFIYEEEYDKWHMNVSLQVISPELYKYYSSVQRYRYLQDYEMSEPILIYTNIENGLGVFGAHNEVAIISISK